MKNNQNDSKAFVWVQSLIDSLLHQLKYIHCLPLSSINLNHLFYFIIFILNITLSSGGFFELPDQTAFFGKLFYYQLPLTPTEFETISQIEIKNILFNNLPDWLIFKKSVNKFELIGIPQRDDSQTQLLLLVSGLTKNNSRFEDIFALSVSEFSSDDHYDSTDSSKNCTLVISKTFSSIIDVWNVIHSLMPTSLKRMVNNGVNEFYVDEIDDVNVKVQDWSHLYFTFDHVSDLDQISGCQIVILRQECNDDENANRKSFKYKLNKLGLNYFMSPKSSMSSNLENDVSDLNIFGEIFESKTNKRHQRRELDHAHHHHTHPHPHSHPHYHTTPLPNPNWINLEVSTVPRNFENEVDATNDPLVRMVPSMISPAHSVPFDHHNHLTTPLMPDHVRHVHRYETPLISSTPIVIPEAPTFLFTSETVDPTFTTDSEKLDVSRTIVFISPSPTFSISSQPSTSLSTSIVTPSTSFSSSPPNRPPVIKNRISKLALTAGKYWQYVIPKQTFYDPEDGYALKLGFYLNNREHPSKDFWIQFDSENGWLFAYPTDDEAGVHTFILEAIDSSGLSTTELIEVHVRQHKGSRAFHYDITFSKVTWDSLKFSGMVEAMKNLATRVSRLYDDNSIEHFIIKSYRSQTINQKKYWTVTFTNDSLPAYPCPQKLIIQLFNKLIDPAKSVINFYSAPSAHLAKIGGTFNIEGVSLSFSETCNRQDQALRSQERPALRNSIDKIEFKLGQVFKYQIPRDTFYAPHGKDSYDLDLNVYTIDGLYLTDDNFVKFNENTFELIGLAIDRKYLKDNEFRLVARDKINGLDESDAFVITITEPINQDKYTFESSFGLSFESGDLNLDLDLDTKLDIANKISSKLFGDEDTRFLTILKITKGRYIPILKDDLKENDLSRNDLILRAKRTTGLATTYYKFVWTNSSNPLLAYGNQCPSHAIQETIHKQLFGREGGFEEIEEAFKPKYRLIFVAFNATKKCSSSLSPNVIYKDNLEPIFVTSEGEEEVEVYSISKTDQDLDNIDENEMEEQDITEYYLKTIVPAMITIAVMLFISCILFCVLLRQRRKQEKRFNLLHRSGDANTRGSFISKDHLPFIFEADLQQQHLLSQSANMVLMPSNTSSQQHLPLRSLNKSLPYQPLISRSSEQRRQPPPYINK